MEPKCFWSEKDGNSTATWADAHLTSQGETNAAKAKAFWQSQFTDKKQPAPQSYYVSPLTRCLDSANLTFNGVSLPTDRPFVPTVKELLRETITIMTQNRRSSRSFIQDRYPTWNIEAGFTESDTMWNATFSETSDAQDVRERQVLDDIFATDNKQIININTHSGTIASVLRILGHRAFPLTPGQIVVTLVKAEAITNPIPLTTVAWKLQPTCTSPPVTSNAAQGCVCSTTAAF
jgi:broad specificity phosphatase PhoE